MKNLKITKLGLVTLLSLVTLSNNVGNAEILFSDPYAEITTNSEEQWDYFYADDTDTITDSINWNYDREKEYPLCGLVSITNNGESINPLDNSESYLLDKDGNRYEGIIGVQNIGQTNGEYPIYSTVAINLNENESTYFRTLINIPRVLLDKDQFLELHIIINNQEYIINVMETGYLFNGDDCILLSEYFNNKTK